MRREPGTRDAEHERTHDRWCDQRAQWTAVLVHPLGHARAPARVKARERLTGVGPGEFRRRKQRVAVCAVGVDVAAKEWIGERRVRLWMQALLVLHAQRIVDHHRRLTTSPVHVVPVRRRRVVELVGLHPIHPTSLAWPGAIGLRYQDRGIVGYVWTTP